MRRIQNRVQICGIVLMVLLTGNSVAGAKEDRCALNDGVSPQAQSAGPCNFDPQARSFKGTPAQQAVCLTREVAPTQKIGRKTLTPFFRESVGKPAPSVEAVQALLDAQKIKPSSIGGSIKKPISANYFIIHDTSTPNCSEGTVCGALDTFPADMNEASWSYNKSFSGHPKPKPDRFAHTMTNRVGESITEGDFSETIVSTLFEGCVDASAKTGLFVGVENIQPRLNDPKYPWLNDYVAPTPGFTAKQYERLALLYVVASARRGHWLIPVFHGVLDQFYRKGHNDPQNFDMTAFSNAVERHYEAIAAGAPATNANLPVDQAPEGVQKLVIPALDTMACRKISATASTLKREEITKATQYYTGLYPSGLGEGEDKDFKRCINKEGYCIVGNVLYSYEGEKFDRGKEKFIFGRGNGGEYNSTNALTPCRTLAADQSYYPSGTVIYIPSLKGKLCPQNGAPVDGCFIVGDVGSAIKRQGRFDIFTGECARYEAKSHVCIDKWSAEFTVSPKTEFRVVPREDERASALRKEVDAFINNGWRTTSP